MEPSGPTDFTVIERDYLRAGFVPDFEWTRFERPTDPVPLTVPVTRARVALVSTSGAYLAVSQEPFDTLSDLGDDSFRVVPGDVVRRDVALAHPGYVTSRAAKDLDCVFPSGLLQELAARGEVGSVAPRHVSFMGYIPHTERLLSQTAPAAAQLLVEDGVDLALLVPT